MLSIVVVDNLMNDFERLNRFRMKSG